MQGNSKAVANCKRTKCAAYEFVESHRRSNKVNTIKNNLMKDKDITKDNFLPG